MKVVVFWEETFPVQDSLPVPEAVLREALVGHEACFAGIERLPEALADADLLVLPNGSAFPKACWEAMHDYLRSGGRWLQLGGAPLTRPVRRVADGWQVETEQHAYGQQVMIRYTFPVEVAGAGELSLCCPEAPDALRALRIERSWALQVLLTDDAILNELGSSGYRHAVLTPLLHVRDGERILAAPAVLIEHHGGPFMGGRWVLLPCQTRAPFSAEMICALCVLALQPTMQLSAQPTFACYQQGEAPAVTVRVACEAPCDWTIHLQVRGIDEETARYTADFRARTGLADAFFTTPPLPISEPGLYLLHASATRDGDVMPLRQAENGFWIYDEALLARTSPLSVNADYFLRDGHPYPVTGTTYMSTTTHRTWMFEPSPAAWERDFAAMRRAGVNMVRTGLWMGWKRAMIEIGAVDEGAIRALQAMLLSAARHDMPVIFTAFAFTPEGWGGAHPYLDARAVRAQCVFLSALSQRLAPMPHLLWDFINEPSFANTGHLWSCRPNYSAQEERAWRQWLQAQGVSDDEWRERWRLTPDEALSLPTLEDFHFQHNLQGSKPLRAMDYVRFAQDVFARWAATMHDVIRGNGNPHQLVTVGQDESGGMQSPSPHFHGRSVDFTSNHSWWQNDDLLWDNLLTTTPWRPHLMQETGIMFAERVDGMPWRTPEMARDLLEHKMALAFAGGGGGFIQWLWNTCIYNNSDNEAGIGLLRADGSEKPELQALRDVARFMAKHAGEMRERKPERTVVIVPHSNLFSVENTADTGTRRSVRTLEYRLGIPCRGASEYFPDEIGEADLLVLPSPRILREECWQALLAKVADGATLLVTGCIDADEYWRPAPRLAPFGLQVTARPLLHEETLTLPGVAEPQKVAFPVQAHQGMLECAAAGHGPLACTCLPHGRGSILYCPAPIEHALAEEATEWLYRYAAAMAGIPCGKRAGASSCGSPALLVRPVHFAACTLMLLVNESASAQQVLVESTQFFGFSGGWSTTLEVASGRITVAFLDNASGNIIAQHRAGGNESAPSCKT